MNCHKESVTHDLEILRVSHEVEVEQARESSVRKGPPRPGGHRTLRSRKMIEVSRTEENMIPATVEACRARGYLF